MSLAIGIKSDNISNSKSQRVLELSQLQNFIKRDSDAYKDEFELQHKHFLSELALFQLNPTTNSPTFAAHVTFLSHVSACFPEELSSFAKQLCDILEQHAIVIVPELRMIMVKALILMRNKETESIKLIEATELLPLFFRLFRVPDKQLRKVLHNHIVKDIKKTNKRKTGNKLNASLQSFLYTMLQDSSSIAAKKSLDVLIELYRTKVWTGEKTVNVIATACLSSDTKTMVAALKFFLTTATEDEDEDEDEKMDKAVKQAIADYNNKKHSKAKKTKKRQKAILQAAATLKKKKAIEQGDHYQPNFEAIHLINNPQGLAEKLFGKLKKCTERFEVRLMMMNLISRLIFSHQLLLPNFYPFLLRYMQPHQQHVTLILAISAQACHEMVDPDSLLPLVKIIANNFVSDRNTPEAMVVGINTIREICNRTPYVLVGEHDLVQDLVQYKRFPNKGVVMAARALLRVIRQTNPYLLAKKDRGKSHREITPAKFGEAKAATGVAGIELLQEAEAQGSGDEDDDSDDDEDDNDDNDGENDETSKAEKEEEEDNEPKKRLDAIRLLTDEDFERIDELRMEKQMANCNKRKLDDMMDDEEHEVSENLEAGDIEYYIKRRKMNYDERMKHVQEGREGREFGSSKRFKERTSSTNKEKLKQKNFLMAKRSRLVQQKSNRTVQQLLCSRKKKKGRAFRGKKKK